MIYRDSQRKAYTEPQAILPTPWDGQNAVTLQLITRKWDRQVCELSFLAIYVSADAEIRRAVPIVGHGG